MFEIIKFWSVFTFFLTPLVAAIFSAAQHALKSLLLYMTRDRFNMPIISTFEVVRDYLEDEIPEFHG